jgi:hypothetical protein
LVLETQNLEPPRTKKNRSLVFILVVCAVVVVDSSHHRAVFVVAHIVLGGSCRYPPKLPSLLQTIMRRLLIVNPVFKCR